MNVFRKFLMRENDVTPSNMEMKLTSPSKGKVSLPGLSCHDVTDRVFPYDLGFTVYLRRCYGRYGGKCR